MWPAYPTLGPDELPLTYTGRNTAFATSSLTSPTSDLAIVHLMVVPAKPGRVNRILVEIAINDEQRGPQQQEMHQRFSEECFDSRDDHGPSIQ